MGPDPAVAAVRTAVRGLLTSGSPPLRRADGGVSRDAKVESQVWVACSGGADSLALAAATAFVAPRLGIGAGLITVDHGLQNGSAEQAARVAALGFELGFDPVVTVPVVVDGPGGPEAAARDARYAALAAAAGEAPVLLGHTLDDQAETVLLGLGRGSGARSIAGMRAVDGRWLRPLLGLRRTTTAAACSALGLTPWDDPHNLDPGFRRVRVRREALPLLEDLLSGGVAEALARTADLLRDDADALDAWAASVLADLCAASHRLEAADPVTGGANRAAEGLLCAASDRVGGPDPATGGAKPVDPATGGAKPVHPAAGGAKPPLELDVAALTGLPRAVRTRVLRQWAERAGAEPLTAERTAALDALVTDWHGQARVELPGGVAVVRASGRLVPCPF